jgi:hypothetical protein
MVSAVSMENTAVAKNAILPRFVTVSTEWDASRQIFALFHVQPMLLLLYL